MLYLRYVIAAWNLIVFLLYGIDKLKATKKFSRISEFSLIVCAILTGGLGATVGMIVFNHKTKKPKFRFFVPLSLGIWLYVYYYIL
ncbi:MAG: DUF1294 domain-containing protein [Clostridia bacterium]|nr:DUF1294 domain-containing protein [Clostridia bacterium]